MSKEALKFIEKYITKDQKDWLVEKKDIIAIFMESYHNQQLRIAGVSDTFEFDATALSKSDQIKFMMLLNSGVKLKKCAPTSKPT